MSVTNFITIAVRGSKSDITDLHKRLVAFENEGKMTMDYRTMALVRMLDDSADVSFYGIELKSPTLVEFETYWEKRPSLGKILQQLKSAYEDTDVFFHITIDQGIAPSPIVYDPEHEIFDFDEPAFYLDKDFDPEEDDFPWDEYDEWRENLSEDEEDEEEDDDKKWSVEEDEEGNLNFCVCGVDFKMVKVEAGSFMMGAAENQVDDAYQDRELPAHQVTISNDFYIAETPVTWELWGEVMDEDYDDDDEPMMAYDWYDTYKFISRLNEITGKQFRLPTEAEWEYAARGGKKSKGYKYSGSNNVDEVAWYDGNSHDNRNPNPEANTHPVKLKLPNELGLYDMSGNMWEQCHDGYAEYSGEAQTDPVGDPDSELKVLRGGCHESSGKSCRTSHRFYIEAKSDDDDIDTYDNTTYRLVLSPFMPEDIPTDFDEEDEDEDCREHISSREGMVGIPVAQVREYTYGFEITDEEAKILKDNDSVKIYVRGPYFASNEAIVEDKISVFDRDLPLGLTFYEFQSALEEKWEENDYGHNFEDFVIEVFDMKITKGNVRIYIELGS